MKRFNTFSKLWFQRIIKVALLDMQLSYILAFLGRENIAETLSITVVTEIIGVFTAYCLKSFFETREQERVRLKEMEMENKEDEIE